MKIKTALEFLNNSNKESIENEVIEENLPKIRGYKPNPLSKNKWRRYY